MITAWRIVQSALATSALDGEGAWRYGGRWNSPGTRMVYLSESRSLAALEILVHADRSLLGQPYSLIGVRFAENLCVELAPLPAGWDRSDLTPAQQAGDQWVASNASLVLQVPSAVMPWERNYLLNPAHPAISKIETTEAEIFRFDPRLL